MASLRLFFGMSEPLIKLFGKEQLVDVERAINNGCCPEACHCKLGETVMAKGLGFGRGAYLVIIDPVSAPPSN